MTQLTAMATMARRTHRFTWCPTTRETDLVEVAAGTRVAARALTGGNWADRATTAPDQPAAKEEPAEAGSASPPVYPPRQ